METVCSPIAVWAVTEADRIMLWPTLVGGYGQGGCMGTGGGSMGMGMGMGMSG